MRGRLGLSAQALKWIAMVSMLIDHVGIYLGRCNVDWEIWKWFRIIGRIAFPLYCFLLVEGFFHTGDIKKYLIRIGAFALISEIPFDLFLCGTWFYPGYQNVGVTFFIGLLLLYLYNRFVGNVQPIYAIMALISMMCLGLSIIHISFFFTPEDTCFVNPRTCRRQITVSAMEIPGF